VNFTTAKPKRSKYRNVKVVVDGIRFDSKREAAYYNNLVLCKRTGAIKDLQLQVPFVLSVNGHKICTYRADFVVDWSNGKTEVIDVKGVKTKEYLLKKKLMFAVHNITIVEV
jgi:hypothetical protein